MQMGQNKESASPSIYQSTQPPVSASIFPYSWESDGGVGSEVTEGDVREQEGG